MAGERPANDAIMALTFATSSSRHLGGLGGTQSWQGRDSAALQAAVLLLGPVLAGIPELIKQSMQGQESL